MPRTIVVIGNGPSLRGFDLTRLRGVDTLGMNAAYRHWDRIGWYPTYYCCLDDQLIQTHHAEIRRLVEKGQVKGAFVHGSFFDLNRDCASDKRFWSFDQFHPHWYKKRGSRFGFEFVDAKAFKTNDTSKVTTGSYAVRFCAQIGYDVIGLLGIDLRYVEVLPEAKRTEGVGLVMETTPEKNPNYFFDDYQQAGDRYNIPNPDVHQGDLHVASFRVLRDDFHRNSASARIINCNPASALNDESIFPFYRLEDLISENKLGAVVVPTNEREKDQILANLYLWSTPAFAPFLGPAPDQKSELVFVFNNESARPASEEIASAFERHGMDRFFSGIRFEFLDLAGDRDRYSRVYEGETTDEGYKAGPNNQFFMTMNLLKDSGYYAFLMEADCIPIRPDWLRKMTEIVNTAEPFWIMGSAYRGKAKIDPRFARHINGNAVYAVGDPAFQSFLSEWWEAKFRILVQGHDRRLAYDCGLEMLFSVNQGDPHSDTWREWQRVADKFRYTGFIQNISAKDDIESYDDVTIRSIRNAQPETFLVHSQAAAGAMAKMARYNGYPEPKALERIA